MDGGRFGKFCRGLGVIPPRIAWNGLEWGEIHGFSGSISFETPSSGRSENRVSAELQTSVRDGFCASTLFALGFGFVVFSFRGLNSFGGGLFKKARRIIPERGASLREERA